MDRAEIEAVLGPARHGLTGILTRYKLIWAGLAAVVLIAGYFLLFSGGSGPKVSYISEAATRGDLTVIVTATGTVQPTNQVDVSSELSGTVRKVLVDFNSEVKVGGVLAELDTDKLQATLASSRAKLNSAKAKVGIAKATLTETALDYRAQADARRQARDLGPGRRHRQGRR